MKYAKYLIGLVVFVLFAVFGAQTAVAQEEQPECPLPLSTQAVLAGSLDQVERLVVLNDLVQMGAIDQEEVAACMNVTPPGDFQVTYSDAIPGSEFYPVGCPAITDPTVFRVEPHDYLMEVQDGMTIQNIRLYAEMGANDIRPVYSEFEFAGQARDGALFFTACLNRQDPVDWATFTIWSPRDGVIYPPSGTDVEMSPVRDMRRAGIEFQNEKGFDLNN